MSGHVPIPRLTDGPLHADPPVTDAPAWRPALLDGVRTASIRCPKGHVAFLEHEIADDGTVSPSVVCPHFGCDRHVWVRLEDWGT